MSGTLKPLYYRLSCLCARAWGMSPGSVRIQGRAGEISLEDVVETYLLMQVETRGRAGLWLRRELEMERQAAVETMGRLVTLYKATRDPEARERIREQMREVNQQR